MSITDPEERRFGYPSSRSDLPVGVLLVPSLGASTGIPASFLASPASSRATPSSVTPSGMLAVVEIQYASETWSSLSFCP